MRVLVVDDSSLLRERLIASLAEFKDIQVIAEAENLAEANEFLKHHAPDVIFLDIRLPDGVSIELIREIKESLPNTKVIVLTNYPYPQYKTQCMKNGSDYFLEKKKDFEKIPEIMKKVLMSTS